MTPADVAADFDEVVWLLEDVHVDFVDQLGADRYAEVREEARGRLGEVHDAGAFWWVVAPLVAAGGDGHTHLEPPEGERRAAWDVTLSTDGVWITSWGLHDGPALPDGGARLVSLDGVPGDALAEAMFDRMAGETDGFRWRAAEERFATAAAPAVAGLSGGGGDGDWQVVLEGPDGARSEGVVSARPGERDPEPDGRGYLNVDVAEAAQTAWDTGGAAGPVVVHVAPGGAGDRAGLVAGDVILSVDGAAVPTVDALTAALRQTQQRQEVTLAVRRGASDVAVGVRLGSGRSTSRAATFAWGDDALWLHLHAFEDTADVLRALDAHLAELPARGVDQVVVDLRGNRGGDAELAEGLCERLCRTSAPGLGMDWRRTRASKRMLFGGATFLAPLAWVLSGDVRRFLATPDGEDFVYEGDPVAPTSPFDGRVVVLTDDLSYSASVYATWLLVAHGGAEHVGSGPGSGTWFHGQPLFRQLGRSDLVIEVSTSTFRCDRTAGAAPIVSDRPMDPDAAFRALTGR